MESCIISTKQEQLNMYGLFAIECLLVTLYYMALFGILSAFIFITGKIQFLLLKVQIMQVESSLQRAYTSHLKPPALETKKGWTRTNDRTLERDCMGNQVKSMGWEELRYLLVDHGARASTCIISTHEYPMHESDGLLSSLIQVYALLT